MLPPFPPYVAIERALTEVILAARAKGVAFRETHLITTSAEWDRDLTVLFFYPLDADVEAYQADGTSVWAQEKFISELHAAKRNFDFSELPNMTFEFDSHENVVNNYQGNYFLRLR